jgi:Domain of unknown function (DUF4365)
MDTHSHASLVGRRAELMAELFLQDLEPTFLARPTTDLGYDFFVGFSNPRGGINTTGVVVKATPQRVPARFPVDIRSYHRLANSNIPGLFLVVDVKHNRLFYAWPASDEHVGNGRHTIALPVSEIDDVSKVQLRRRLTGSAP